MSLRPRSPNRQPRRPVLIVCEGEIETNYFRALKKYARNNLAIDVRSSRGGGHKGVWNEAVKNTGNNKRRGSFDEVWCVFDVESDESDPDCNSLAETINKCAGRDFGIALSNPCFNIWLLAHLDQVPRQRVKSDESRRSLEAACGGVVQPRNIDWIRKRFFDEDLRKVEAAARSPCCLPDLNNIIEKNPSTRVHILVNWLVGPAT